MKLQSTATLTAALLLALNLTGCGSDGNDGVPGLDGQDGADGSNGVSQFVTTDDVVTTNANIAYAVYSDALITAIDMKAHLQALVDNPSADTFAEAKQAWLDAREPYGQSEVYRFRQGPIDAVKSDGAMGEEGDGPEGRINAWPLGEALIDYVAAVVDGDANPESPANALSSNIIANTTDYPQINKAVLLGLFEHGEDERNVTTGYHAIEFLLWGQDLNQDLSGSGPRDATGGQRPYSDYATTANGNPASCTSGEVAASDEICARRGAYLLAAADLLIEDLSTVVNSWEPNVGAHYKAFVAGGDVSLAKILEGMGRLSFGELAGERINIALTTDSQEDEHSCFSDNTHRDIYLNAKGIQNSYNANYIRVNGEVVEGASIHDLLVVEGYHELANQLRAALERTQAGTAVIDTKAKSGVPFDQLIQQGVNQANVVEVINALIDQTEIIEQAISALGVTTNDLRQDTQEF